MSSGYLIKNLDEESKALVEIEVMLTDSFVSTDRRVEFSFASTNRRGELYLDKDKSNVGWGEYRGRSIIDLGLE